MEALLLGLSVGLACLASCGAVLVPWLVVQRRSFAATAWLLAQVLAGRLAGYLLFGVVAWALGLLLVPADLRTRALLFGAAHVALAAMLGWYAVATLRRPRGEPRPARGGRFVRWRMRLSRAGPAALGLLTGVNLCPPFLAATVRAAERRSLPGSLAFFIEFFLGTSVWFVPFLAAGAARRWAQAPSVARAAMGTVAAYYAYAGAVTLGWRFLHG
jgi:sulfite exporter TauE/SafE